jgi:hypothetical protein
VADFSFLTLLLFGVLNTKSQHPALNCKSNWLYLVYFFPQFGPASHWDAYQYWGKIVNHSKKQLIDALLESCAERNS